MTETEIEAQKRKLPTNICLLSGNALKLIACLFMTCDHVGYMMFPGFLYPDLAFLRYIGRLAFPIFCYMIAEGAYYTKSPKIHFLTIAGLGIFMQVVLYIAMRTTEFTVFIIFAFSVLLIRLSDFAVLYYRRAASEEKKRSDAWLCGLFALLFVTLLAWLYYACYHTVELARDFDANYGFIGIVTPLALYLVKKYLPTGGNGQIEKYSMIAVLGVGMYLIYATSGPDYQWLSLLALPLLALYSGKRGKLHLKYFFYLYYPLHMVVIAGITELLGL